MKVTHTHKVITLAASIVIYVAAYIYAIRTFNFNNLEKVLLFLSGSSLLFFITPFFKWIISRYNAGIQKEQKRINKHIVFPQKQGKKPFSMGPKKQHTVWATNLLAAQKIYNLKIQPK